MFEIKIVPLAQARTILLGPWPTLAVSMIDTDVSDFPSRGAHHLVVQANDVGTRQPIAYRHVAEILDFTAQASSADRVLVNCMAGLSRSPALAIGVLIGGGLSWEAAFSRVEGQQPMLSPNTEIIRFVDDYFDLGGQLTRHTAAWHEAKLGKLILPKP
jgi:predicted protein tyrosine phosphatase